MFRFLIGRLFQGMLVLLALYTITFFLAKAMPGEPFTSEKKSRPRPRPTSASSMVWTNPFGNSTSFTPRTSSRKDLSASPRARGDQWATSSRNPSPTPPLGALRFGIRHRNRRTHRRTFGCSQEQLGRLDLHGRGHDRDLRSFLHHRSSFANLRCRSPSGPEGGRLGQPPGCSSAGLYPWPCFRGVLGSPTRGGILEVLSQDFVRTAHAKGVSPTKVILKHTLRGGLLPAVAYLGPAFRRLDQRVLYRGDDLSGSRHGTTFRQCSHHA